MGENYTPDEPHDTAGELMSKAAEWRAKAEQTSNSFYIALMLRTAEELEALAKVKMTAHSGAKVEAVKRSNS